MGTGVNLGLTNKQFFFTGDGWWKAENYWRNDEQYHESRHRQDRALQTIFWASDTW